ncbi:hypothetical protein [Streptomyces sp. NBC_01298]|uniref:hypothetical protein n=1 Tax=Streptomyces sp. NBC_01298 TaxID=2903817 RepID=UPI003FA343B4
MAVVAKMGVSAPTEAGARLGDVRCPALIVEGDLDTLRAYGPEDAAAVHAAR